MASEKQLKMLREGALIVAQNSTTFWSSHFCNNHPRAGVIRRGRLIKIVKYKGAYSEDKCTHYPAVGIIDGKEYGLTMETIEWKEIGVGKITDIYRTIMDLV